MAASFGLNEQQAAIGRTQLGYTNGLPSGISLADSQGNIAPILTAVYPSSGANGIATTATSGILVWDPAASALKVWTGTAWKQAALS